MPRDVCEPRAGCGIGSVRAPASNGGIERQGEMKMFPAFPVLFPASSQSCPVECLRSVCSGFPATTHMDAVSLLLNYIQQL